MCSKEDWTFEDAGFPKVDENTVIKTYDGPEKGIPHFYVNLDEIRDLFRDFNIQRIRHIDDCYDQGQIKHIKHYYITATYDKEEVKLDYSNIIGKTVKGKIDRPLGTKHPRFDKLTYPINYGYVEGVMANDGAEQDIYLLGVDHPVETYEGVVIAVLHRYNDIEDKWIVAPKGRNFTDEEILEQVYFQEKYFDIELFR
jgi:inorganic pyrophosphatase